MCCFMERDTARSSLQDKTDSKLLQKLIQKTSAVPLTVSLRVFLYSFPTTYFRSLFLCTICPSFFNFHHCSLTVSPNPFLSRRRPWKGGPLLNLLLLWSPAISSPLPCNLSFLSVTFPSHLLTVPLLLSLGHPPLPPARLLSLPNPASSFFATFLLLFFPPHHLCFLLFLFDPVSSKHCSIG